MSNPNPSENSSGLLTRDPRAAELWERLRHFSFDEGNGPRTFAQRLALEQGWSAAFTARAIEEYRRFLLLFALSENGAADAPADPPRVRIVPSAVVDKVWHLHLLYTRSYWGTLCGEILGRPLHHRPADGSPGEPASLADVHRANMDAYRATFGKEPPIDIWPAALRLPMVPSPSRKNSPATAVLPPLAAVFTFLAAGLTILLAFGVQANSTPGAGLEWITGLCVLFGVVFVGGLFITGANAAAGGSAGSHRVVARRRFRAGAGGGAGDFFSCGDSGGVTVVSGDASGNHGHSHAAHTGSHDGSSHSHSCGGHSHSCGGHSCGGHSCGGHGCGGH